MIRVMHIVPGLGSSGAERGATDLARTLNRERFEVGANSLPETRSARTWVRSSRETGVPRGASGQAPGFNRRMFVRVARVPDRFRPQGMHTPTEAVRFLLGPPLRRSMAHAGR